MGRKGNESNISRQVSIFFPKVGARGRYSLGVKEILCLLASSPIKGLHTNWAHTQYLLNLQDGANSIPSLISFKEAWRTGQTRCCHGIFLPTHACAQSGSSVPPIICSHCNKIANKWIKGLPSMGRGLCWLLWGMSRVTCSHVFTSKRDAV